MRATSTTVTPPRPASRSAVAGVLATGAVLGGLGATLAVADPAQVSWLPPCPFHTVTGWWCPGCGLTRATHHLLRGELGAALSRHLFAPLVLAAIVIGWWSTLQVSLGRPATTWPRLVPRRVWLGLALAVAVYSVARNLAWFRSWGP